MTTLKKYNLIGEEIGTVAAPCSLVSCVINSQLIKDYIVALRANARQWSANTKGRSEVSSSTQKPHKQKGLGRSRQGSLVAPQYKGGGRVFGPKPKFDYHVKINRKEKRLAMRSILSEKIEAGKLHILECTQIETPKTKVFVDFMKKIGVHGRRVIFLSEASFEHFEIEGESLTFQVPSYETDAFALSVRNIDRAHFSLVTNISGYDLICAHEIVITEKALSHLSSSLAE
ncbi:MAG: 50S ribosomal protein L4 [Chlamydiae bacterium]|nr:50S ribosomal protein L4 [Chlamydiota bacterium]